MSDDLPTMEEHANALHPVNPAGSVMSTLRKPRPTSRDADPAATSDRKADNAVRTGDVVKGLRQSEKSREIRSARGEPVSNSYDFGDKP